MLKALQLQKVLKDSSLKGCGTSYEKKLFSKTIMDRVFEENLDFIEKSTPQEKFQYIAFSNFH